MVTEQELRKQIADLESQLKPLKEQLTNIYEQTADEIDEKIKRCHLLKDKFLPEELLFAAYVRCPCGAGMAYPKGIGVRNGRWNCSAILLGEADVKTEHEAALPFAFYEIKSENQPSANGATTRTPLTK